MHFDIERDIHVSSENCEANGDMTHDVDLLIIMHSLRTSYPTRRDNITQPNTLNSIPEFEAGQRRFRCTTNVSCSPPGRSHNHPRRAPPSPSSTLAPVTRASTLAPVGHGSTLAPRHAGSAAQVSAGRSTSACPRGLPMPLPLGSPWPSPTHPFSHLPCL